MILRTLVINPKASVKSLKIKLFLMASRPATKDHPLFCKEASREPRCSAVNLANMAEGRIVGNMFFTGGEVQSNSLDPFA